MDTTTMRATRAPGVIRRGFGVLGQGIREQPRSFAVAVIGAALYGGMTVASAYVLGEVTDRVVIPALEAQRLDRAALVAGCAVIVTVGVVKAIGIVLRRVGATFMQLKLEATYRERVSEAYQRLPIAWHQRQSTGDLLSVANTDVEAAWWPVAPLPFSTGVALMLVITAVALLATDPYLALVGFCIGPAMGWLNHRYNRQTQGPQQNAQRLRGEVSGIAHESFDGALVVKTLGREGAETARFEERSQQLRDELITIGRYRATFDPLLEALPNIGVLAVLLVGSFRVTQGALTTGDLVSFSYLFTLLAFPVRMLGYLIGEFPRSVAGWERVRGVLDAPGTLDYGQGSGNGHAGPASADLVSVTFSYPVEEGEEGEEGRGVWEPRRLDQGGAQRRPSERGLRDLTFGADAGRTIALVGPTGSGKSTIASLLVRLSDPGEGTVHLDGRDLRTLRRGAVSEQAAIVFQHSFLFDDTVRENITLGGDHNEAEVEAACRLAQAWGFVQALPQGLDTVVGERGTTLSGGQRQRVALARALVRRPRLLILDDATSSVDTRVEAAILHGLRDAALPSTIIVVAYRQATIALADEIVFIQGGEVIARGQHRDLLADVPAYANLVQAYDREQGQ